MIGKEIRLKRLIPVTDGKYFGLTVDHAIARGVMPGLDTIDDTLSKMVAGGPNAITMHKGIAEKCFAPYAGKVVRLSSQRAIDRFLAEFPASLHTISSPPTR